MSKHVAFLLIICCIGISVGATDNEFPHCCDDEGSWSVHSILECQRVSDFLIALAYFSIPIELLYFISCSNFPFKWVLLQFIAFIVLCGLTHLLNAWTYYGQQSFQLMLWLTIAKFFTALVSCATTITLLTLFPLLLKWKTRELFLEQNVLELGQEIGIMKRQKEASWHVRMLTKEIRKSLDKHNILYTTLVELSKTLDLHNCAVWMPNDNRTKINLTHELKPNSSERISIPITDRDVFDIKKSKGINVEGSLPEHVMGDERRTFQVILHMVGYFLNICDGGGTVFFRVFSENSSDDMNDRMLGMWKANAPDDYLRVKFEVEVRERSSSLNGSWSSKYPPSRRQTDNEISLSFSMCKKLVQMMQGNIWITPSSDGFAQTMSLVLKFQTCPSFANGRAILPLRSSPEIQNLDSQFKGLHVLLADDDGVNRIVTKKLLEKLGCEVTAVSSGFECLSAITPAENRFQIVILDLYMPEMDGFEVAMRIRKYHSRNWPAIIAVTASAEDDVWERCLELGMNGLIRKPVLLQRIAEELRRVLQRAGEGL
ncbi:hypothetical protein ACFE04_024631 [Oxalis oulophora]